MGGKHKKVLRSEKAKVKLKGAKLPKGLNVTKTDFKVKKIVLLEQLEDGFKTDGQRKQNIKDIINRLKHHSTTMRLEALRLLKGCIVANPNDVSRQLGTLIQGIAMLSLDIENEIRRESFKVLSALFGVIPVETIEPFFHIISSYLRCAMTHIQPSIQEDSLLLLDALLNKLPQLVATNSEKIFADFLDMISMERSDSSKPNRILIINLSNKTTTIKWRSKVLLRLRGMLKTLVDYKNNKLLQGNSCSFYEIRNRFYPNQPQFYPIIQNSLNDKCNLPSIFNKSIGYSKRSDASEIIRGYIEHLMPLLFESWIEVSPTIPTDDWRSSSDRIILSHDGAYSLKVVLEICEQLWELTDLLGKEVSNTDLNSWFKTKYANDFGKHFLRHFPYQQAEGSTGLKNKNKVKQLEEDVLATGGQYCLIQNLKICYLYCIFFRENLKKHSEFNNKILEYVYAIVREIKTLNMDYFQVFEKTVREILSLNGERFLTYNEATTKSILSEIIRNFEVFQRDAKTKIVILLCDIVLSSQLCETYGPHQFDEWLQSVPQLLLEPTISHQTILALSNLGKQRNPFFLRALSAYVIKVIENISVIQTVGSENQFEGKKLIMNLFYWNNELSLDERKQYLQTIDDASMKDQRIPIYFKSILGIS